MTLAISSLLLLGELGLLSRVDRESGVVVTDLSDKTLAVEIFDDLSGDCAVHLELVGKLRHGDREELGCILDDSLVSLLVEEDGVVELFLDLDLGPRLLLSLSSTGLLSGESSSLGRLVTFGIFALILLLCLYNTLHVRIRQNENNHPPPEK